MIWKITNIGRGKKTWREQASPSVTFPYLRDSKILILFQNMHFVYSTTKYRNLRLKRATYVKFRCISAVETITLWRRRKKKQMTSQRRINARGYIRHWPNLVMVYRVTFMQSFNTRSSCSIKATMPQYYIEAYNIDTKNLGFLNADITSYLCKKVFSSKHIVTWKIATMNSIFWIGCKDIQNLPNKFQL